MLRRLKSPFMTWLTVCLLVFTQLAVSAYACAGTTLPVEMADAAAITSMTTPMAAMPDCEMGAEKERPVICQVHCQKDAQSADNNVPTLHPPLLLVLFFTAPFADAAQPLAAALSLTPAAVASSPPLRIQYQVFRI